MRLKPQSQYAAMLNSQMMECRDEPGIAAFAHMRYTAPLLVLERGDMFVPLHFVPLHVLRMCTARECSLARFTIAGPQVREYA